MGAKHFMQGLAGNFIVSAFIAYFTNQRVAVIAFCIGLALLLLATLMGKKQAQEPPLPAVNQNVDVKHQANPQMNNSPQFNISLGNSTTTPAPLPSPEQQPEPLQNIKFVDVIH